MLENRNGLVAIITDDQERRIDYYGVSNNGDKTFAVTAIGNSFSQPFTGNITQSRVRPITSKDHQDYIVRDAKRHGFDVLEVTNDRPYDAQVLMGVFDYFTALEDAGVHLDRQELTRRVEQVRVPYADVRSYRVKQARRFFSSLAFTHDLGLSSHARTACEARDFLIFKSPAPEVKLGEMSAAFDTDFLDLDELVMRANYSYINTPEDFPEYDNKLLKTIDKRLTKRRYRRFEGPNSDGMLDYKDNP